MQVTVDYDNTKLSLNQVYIEQLVPRNAGEANGVYLKRATETIVRRAVRTAKLNAQQAASLATVETEGSIL